MIDNGYGSKLSYYLQETRRFSIDSEEERERVWEALSRVKPVLIVFDTINTYIGKADTNQGSQTQQNFMWFREMAQEFGSAVLVLRHLTKGTREKAMYRGQGSIAFTGVARIEITAGHHPEEEGTRIIAMDKTNLAPFPPALQYHIDKDKVRGRDVARFSFGNYDHTVTAEDIVSAVPARAKAGNTDVDIMTFVEDALRDGPMNFDDIMRMAESRAFSVEAVRRAGKKMSVKRRGKVWSLKVSD